MALIRVVFPQPDGPNSDVTPDDGGRRAASALGHLDECPTADGERLASDDSREARPRRRDHGDQRLVQPRPQKAN